MSEETRIPSIEPQALHALAQREAIDLVDVSTRVEYDEVRLPWARNLPIGSPVLTERMASRSDCERPLYVMCRGGVRSLKVCRQYPGRNLIDVAGGTRRWIDCRLPVAHDAKVMSLERQASLAAGVLLLGCAAVGWAATPLALGVSAGIGSFMYSM